MLRYIAFIWESQDSGRAYAQQQLEKQLCHGRSVQRQNIAWKKQFDAPGLKVFCARTARRSNRSYPLREDGGLIVGTLFRKPPVDSDMTEEFETTAEIDITNEVTKNILKTNGQWLLDNYWGDYVAFLHSNRQRTAVLHAPMSNLAAYRVVFRGVHVVFSKLADLLSLQELPLTINWDYVATHLLWAPKVGGTGLNEVSELRSGERWDFQHDLVETRDVWDPMRIAANESIEDPARAEHTLRSSIITCTHSWASCFDQLLMRLSGGLDSSIILSCLSSSPTRPRITCLNGYRLGAGSDERRYARLASARAKCELIEVAYNEQVRLDIMLDALPFPFPPDTIGSVSTRAAEEEALRERGIQASFNGHDGDGLFARTAWQAGLTDYLRIHGVSSGLFEIAMDAARAQQLIVWQVLRTAIKSNLRHARSTSLEVLPAHCFLSGRLMDALPRMEGLKRWEALARDYRVPPGKAEHARRLCSFMSGNCNPFSDESSRPYPVSPLQSQPVIESALRIPMYLLTAQRGLRLDRPLARRAFASDLPEEILYRRGKGRVEDYSALLIRQNIGFIREMLLGGVLMRKGYLHSQRLEDALSNTPSGEHEGLSILFFLLGVEAWLRKFDRAQVQAAA